MAEFAFTYKSVRLSKSLSVADKEALTAPGVQFNNATVNAGGQVTIDTITIDTYDILRDVISIFPLKSHGRSDASGPAGPVRVTAQGYLTFEIQMDARVSTVANRTADLITKGSAGERLLWFERDDANRIVGVFNIFDVQEAADAEALRTFTCTLANASFTPPLET